MAFVPGFEHDILVSYQHALSDDHPVGEPWVNRLVAHLSIALRRRVGQIVDIHLDRQVDLSQQGRIDLAQHIEHSALFLAVSSPGYLSSERTHWELETALSAESGVQRLIFVEGLPPGPLDPQPEALEDFRKFVFWRADAGTGQPVPLTPGLHRSEFMEGVEQLAASIGRRLLDLRDRAPAEPSLSDAQPWPPGATAPGRPMTVGAAAQRSPTTAGEAARPVRPQGPRRAAIGLGLLAVAMVAAAWVFRHEVAVVADALLETVRAAISPNS